MDALAGCALLRLWDRAVGGGGPGGGGGRGIPGSHRDWLVERLAEREEAPLNPIAPVDAALREAGGRKTDSSWSTNGAIAMA